jgi:hypothetical protein
MATTTAIDITRALATPDLRWPNEHELQWLAEQATTHHRIVEVGSFLGRSTIAMASHTPGLVYAIDDWYGPRDLDGISDEERLTLFDEFLRNTEGLPVRVIRCDHADSAKFPVEWLRGSDSDKPDMIFIDGSHLYDDVCRDIELWKARLRPDGLLCGHDREIVDVRMALDDKLPDWKPAPGHSSLWYWTEGHMATALRKMDIAELMLEGTTKNYAKASAPEPDLTWTQYGTPISKIGLAVMLPTVTHNADGSLRYMPPEWGIGLALQAPLANCRHAILSIKDMERGPARTALVKQARSYGAKWGYFQDDDTVPPQDVLQKLQYVLENADDDVAVVAGIYTNKSDPPCPLVFQDAGVGPHWKWRKGQVFECQAIATGCMMIRMSIFDTLPEPWFVDVHGVEHAKSLGIYGNGISLPLATEWTDDMFFCWRLREHGWRMLAHGGVLCDHWGQDGKVYRLGDDTYPMRGDK